MQWILCINLWKTWHESKNATENTSADMLEIILNPLTYSSGFYVKTSY